MRRFLLLLLLLLLPLTASAGENALLISDGSGKIPDITLYQGPSAYAPAVACCFAGAQAEVLDQGSGFVQVRIGPLTGWIAQEHLLRNDWSEDDATPLPAGEITTLNGERYQYLYNAPDGQPFAALENHFSLSVLAVTADNNRLLVLLPDGTMGYLPVEAVRRTDSPACAWVTASDPSLRLHLRAQPTTKSDSLGNYYCGVEVMLLFTAQTEAGWTRVSVCGQNGWMKTEYLVFGDAIGNWLPPLGKVQGTDVSGLNLRTAPNYDAPILTRYEPGTVVEIMAAYGIWAHVRTQDGFTGYMLLQHLGGDQPAAVANSLLWDGEAVRLLSSRPAAQWLYSSGEATFALPESCTVMNEATGLIRMIPTDALPVWEIPAGAQSPAV